MCPERFLKYVLATMPCRAFTLTRNTQKLNHMHAEIISPHVIAAHDVAAARVAESYVRDLAADTTSSLKRLASYLQTFRSEVAATVYKAAARNRCPGLKVRLDLVERLARGHIKRAVTGTALAAKLVAIRAEQDRRVQAEIAAEQASWTPLPAK